MNCYIRISCARVGIFMATWCSRRHMAITGSVIRLNSLGVTVFAKYHSPSILNKDFLVHHRIIPESWESMETITTPSVSILKYSNGIQWMVDQDRLTITETCNRPFQQNEDSEVHHRASLYVETLPHTPYRALSLNYTASVTREDAASWITQHFLSDAFRHQELIMQPRFIMDTGEAVLDLGFKAGGQSRGNGKHDSIIISCNVHYSRSFSSTDLKNKILGWKDDKDSIYSRLVTMLGMH